MAAALFFKHRRLMLILPRQFGGKTELGCRLMVDLISRPTTKSALFLAKDRKSAKKATREKYERLCPRDRFEVNTEQIYLKRYRSSVLFIDSVDKDPDRIRGGTYGGFHWSEAAFSKIEKGETVISVFDKIIQPTLRLQDGYGLIETTTNGKNEFYQLWENHKEYGFARLLVSLSQMLELGLITLDDYEQVRSTTHPDVFRQEYECEFISFLGRAFPELAERHVDPEMPNPEWWQTVMFGIDWGYAPSATAVLFAYVQDGILCVFDEHYALEETPIFTAEAIDQRRRHLNMKRLTGVADHDPARIVELTNRGIECVNADKVNTMGARMQIKEALYFDRIRIHPRCKWLLKDLENAVWHAKKDGELDDKACTWGHWDAEAALRYLLRMISEIVDEKPEDNQNAAYDTASAAAHEMTRDY